MDLCPMGAIRLPGLDNKLVKYFLGIHCMNQREDRS